MPNVINVSNRLPVTVAEKITKSSGGLVAALEGVSLGNGCLRWIGWPGKAVDDPAERRRIEQTLQKDYGFAPVFLSSEQVEGHYVGFSDASLWPLLHYLPSNFRYEPQWWDAYKQVNQLFCEKVLSIAKENDLVWVHDYHLMLLPRMLKDKMCSLRVGFFLHTPFPSYEVFRCQPKRAELLPGHWGPI
jgi:trehalose 6-phosphate synthase/phosphatase